MKYLNFRTLLLALLVVFAGDAMAQSTRTFLVKDVGNKAITLHQNKQKRYVVPRELLPINAMITIPKGGKLVVYDNVNLRELTIRESGMNILARFLDGSSKESYTKVTFAGLIALLFSNDDQKDAGGTIYRGNEDMDKNSLDEYVSNIREVLTDTTTNLPEDYASILREVLEDIESSENRNQSESDNTPTE